MTPEVVTFEGVLISDSWTYRQHLRPALHLIIYFPVTNFGEFQFTELSSSPKVEHLPLISVEDPHSPFVGVEESLLSGPRATTIDPAQITLTNIHPHSDMHHRIRKRSSHRAEKPLNFQPPSLAFYPLSEVPIAVTLANSLIRKAAYCIIEPEDNGEVSTRDARGWVRFASIPRLSPFANTRLQSSNGNLPLAGNNKKLSSAPEPSISPLFMARPLPEGTFPLTTFDIFAQGSRRQIVCSVTWDAMAHPSGQISLGSGEQKQNEISWDLGDMRESKVSAAARTVHWVNYAPPSNFVPFEITNTGVESGFIDEANQNESLQYTKFTSSSATSRRQSGRFWMLHPPRLLPAPFCPNERQAGSEDVYFHLQDPQLQLVGFFTQAYKKFGFPNERLTEIAQHWEGLLPTIGQRSTNGVLVKFLLHKEISKIFPVQIEPMPADFLRAFAVVWTLNSGDAWEIEQCEPMEVKMGKVQQGIWSHGKSPRGVSLEGFKVFEWGGILLPYCEGESRDDMGEDGSESGSGSDTASDRTIRAISSGSFSEDTMMEDADIHTDTGEDIDTPMGNDVDAVVLGDEGMYIVMRS